MITLEKEIQLDLDWLQIELIKEWIEREILKAIMARPSRINKFKEGYENFTVERSRLLEKETPKCRLDSDNVLRYENWILIPSIM